MVVDNNLIKTNTYSESEKLQTHKPSINYRDENSYFEDGEWKTHKTKDSKKRIGNKNVEFVERIIGGKGLIVFLVILGIMAGLGMGYGLSHVIPDESIRADVVTDELATQLLYVGKEQPEQISRKLTQGYTAKQIEERYILRNDKAQLPGVSAAVQSTDVANFKDGELYRGTPNGATVVLSEDVTAKYINKYEADGTTPVFQSGALYKATGTGDSLNISNTDLTPKYINKYEADGTTARYVNDGLYQATGTGDALRITNTDLTNSYIQKSTISTNALYKPTGTGDALSLGPDLAPKYFSKYEADGTTPKYLNNGLYQASGIGDTLDITDVTNDYIKRSDLDENGIYITTGTGATLTLATKEVPDPNNPGQTITQYDNQINQYIKKSMLVENALYFPVIDPLTNSPTIPLVLDADGNPVLNANGNPVLKNSANEFIQKTSLSTNTFYTSSGTGEDLTLSRQTSIVGSAYVVSDTAQLVPIISNVDDKIKHFQMYKVYEGGPSNSLNTSTSRLDVKDVLNKYLPSFAQLTDAEVTTILNNSSKYEIVLYLGDRRTTATLRRRVGVFTEFSGTSYGACPVSVVVAGIKGNSDIENDYLWCITFNSSGSKKIEVQSYHSDERNTFGAIRGLQVIIKQ